MLIVISVWMVDLALRITAGHPGLLRAAGSDSACRDLGIDPSIPLPLERPGTVVLRSRLLPSCFRVPLIILGRGCRKRRPRPFSFRALSVDMARQHCGRRIVGDDAGETGSTSQRSIRERGAPEAFHRSGSGHQSGDMTGMDVVEPAFRAASSASRRLRMLAASSRIRSRRWA